MEVRKESNGLKNSMVTREELAIINQFTKRALKEDEVYTFAVRLCDNEVDRDGERFPRATLEELAELFVGKSGIFDHEWTAKGQAARIYRTEIVEEEGVCSQGEGRCYLKGYAYMLRGGENDALIAQIEGGIKKEVSVGCSVERCVCSICGEDINTCAHKKGEVYGGKVCCAELVNAQDAYEWSFVAVPAQPRAGVLKRCGGEDAGTLKTLVKRRGSRANQRELESLEKQKSELSVQIVKEEMAKPTLSREQLVFWFHRFRKLDAKKLDHRRRLIDSFVNAVFLYDDRITFTFNYKDGTKTINFTELEKSGLGSDINALAAPYGVFL